MDRNLENISSKNKLFEGKSDYELKYSLTPEFFENILNHESNLKEKFDPQIFFELINLYSQAIGYYESLNNSKYKIFNQALIYLFEKPEAKKFMEGKDLSKIFRKKELINKFKQCEKIITEEKVKSLIKKKLDEGNILKTINNIYNNDMNNQKRNLEKIIKEKKEKYLNKKQKKEEEKNKKNNEIFNNKIEIIKNKNTNEKNEEKLKLQFNNEINDHLINKNSSNKEKNDVYQIDRNLNYSEQLNINNYLENQTNITDDYDYNSIIINNKNDLKQSIKLTNKTRFSDKISDNFDSYFKSYYDYFINNKMDIIINDFILKSEKEEKNGCELSVESLNEIKDMEFIIKDNSSGDNYKNEIQKIIDELTLNLNKNIEIIINKIGNFSKKIDSNYLINDCIFKEQFKLDITKLINTFIFK